MEFPTVSRRARDRDKFSRIISPSSSIRRSIGRSGGRKGRMSGWIMRLIPALRRQWRGMVGMGGDEMCERFLDVGVVCMIKGEAWGRVYE